MPREPVTRLISVLAGGALLLLSALALPTIARANETVMVCDIYGNHIARLPVRASGIRASARCPGNDAPARYSRNQPPGGLAIWTEAGRRASYGQTVHWMLRPPPGLTITSVWVPHMYSSGVNDRSGWNASLFWGGGSVRPRQGQSAWRSTSDERHRFTWPARGSRYFGWRLACRYRRCRHAGHQWLSVELVELDLGETRAPVLTANTGLWQSSGWIRGRWVLSFFGNSPSGLCATASEIGSQSGPGSISPRDPSVWHQCSAPAVDQAVDTTRYGQGVIPLTVSGTDAAGRSVTHARTIEVDNQRPTVALQGPTDVSSAAGTQYVRATAAAGPSGVAGIACSLDGGPVRWYPVASAAVAVSGVGLHHVTCSSADNARDEAGVRATSTAATWTLRIRSASVSLLSFVRIADALRCAERRERVRIPAHWTTAYRHGRRVRAWVPAQTRRVRVMRCHPRVEHRRVRRGGHWLTQRIVVLPHRVAVGRLTVRFGQPAMITGWLGTPNGDAVARQTVRIMTAPDNGSRHFSQAAMAETGRDGVWRAQLPRGPSRIVAAVYAGDLAVEPSVSEPARLKVPARVSLRLSRSKIRWGSTIRIRGRIGGGYVPRGGELVFLYVGWRHGRAEIGHLYTGPGGGFSTTYKFHDGTGSETYEIWATSVRQSDYPYAPGRSARVRVTVSP